MAPKKNKKTEENSRFFNEFFEKELTKFIDLRITETQEKLSKEDIRNIIDNLLPDLDKIISDKIKNHMQFLGESLIKTFKQE